jgi:hypothetical protein
LCTFYSRQPQPLPIQIVSELSSLNYTPSAIATVNGDEVAVGAKDCKVYIYARDGATLAQTGEIEGHRGEVQQMRPGHNSHSLLLFRLPL